MGVRESGGKVVFLRTVVEGGASKSYGIEVARLAGLPASVVGRAREILATLEGEHRVVPGGPPLSPDPGQLTLFEAEAAPHPVVEEIRALDLDAMTPLEALNRLAALQRRAEEP
jgi:DNA mismatch repair protein MutS